MVETTVGGRKGNLDGLCTCPVLWPKPSFNSIRRRNRMDESDWCSLCDCVRSLSNQNISLKNKKKTRGKKTPVDGKIHD